MTCDVPAHWSRQSRAPCLDETPIEAGSRPCPSRSWWRGGLAPSGGSGALSDHEDALSEGGSAGYLFLERSDFSHERHKAWTHSRFKGTRPSEVFKRHFMTCFIDDAFGLQNIGALNEDLISYECDYPHSDTLWPEAPEHLWESIKHLTDKQVDKITHLNAMRFFNFDPFKHYKREELAVGSSRKRAVAEG